MIEITKRTIPHSQDHWVRITRLIDNKPQYYLEFAASQTQLQELAAQLLTKIQQRFEQ